MAKTLFAVELLEEMRERHQQLSVVLDEHGGTAGIVTLDDLVLSRPNAVCFGAAEPLNR